MDLQLRKRLELRSMGNQGKLSKKIGGGETGWVGYGKHDKAGN